MDYSLLLVIEFIHKDTIKGKPKGCEYSIDAQDTH